MNSSRLAGYFLRFVLGGLFVFSGLVKLIDPKGTAIKLEEYFHAFSTLSHHYLGAAMGEFFLWLAEYSIAQSLLLSTLEVVLGVAIIFWKRPRLTLSVTVLLLVFFGFLTGYSATCDPNNALNVSCVTDCGCFGDFITLKPIQSFYKDLVFLALALPLLLMAWRTKNSSSKSISLPVLVATTLSLGFGVYNLVNLPIIDFRPYKIGNNLLELRQNGKPAVVHYVMSKGGQTKSFETYPTQPEWTFVRIETVQEATDPTVKDFYLFDAAGNDLTEQILKEDNTFLIIKKAPDPADHLTTKSVRSANPQFNGVISGLPKEQLIELGLITDTMPVFNLDETVIKAMIRSDLGIIRIKNGTVTHKQIFADYLADSIKNQKTP